MNEQRKLLLTEMNDSLTKQKNSFLFYFAIDISTITVRKISSKNKSEFTTTKALKKLLHKLKKKVKIWFDRSKKVFNNLSSEHFKQQFFHFYLNHADLKVFFSNDSTALFDSKKEKLSTQREALIHLEAALEKFEKRLNTTTKMTLVERSEQVGSAKILTTIHNTQITKNPKNKIGISQTLF